MTATHEDAKLILELYNLRREDVIRKARHFFIFNFFPETADDVKALLVHPEHGAYYRQVSTYWDMACALVNHGAINAQLFIETNGEAIAVFSKLEPILPQLRELFGPNYMMNLEKLVRSIPDHEARLAAFRERLKALAAAAAR